MYVKADDPEFLEFIQKNKRSLENDEEFEIPTEPIKYQLNGKELEKFISSTFVKGFKEVRRGACPQKFFLENFDYEYRGKYNKKNEAMLLGTVFEASFNGRDLDKFNIPKTQKGVYTAPFTRAIKAGIDFSDWLFFFIESKYSMEEYTIHVEKKIIDGAFKGIVDVIVEFSDCIVVIDLKFTTMKVGVDAYGENSWNTDKFSKWCVRHQIGRKGQAILYPYLAGREYKKPVTDFYFIVYQQTTEADNIPIGDLLTVIKMEYNENEINEYFQFAAQAHKWASESDFAPKGSFSECKKCEALDCPNRVLFNEFIL